jgi:lipopolysaccharide transport system ATP-binding protein
LPTFSDDDGTVIRAEDLGKKYVIGRRSQAASASLREVLGRQARGFVRRLSDMAAGRPVVEGDELRDVWALHRVSFEVRRGEVLGIIGRNGAGKSTLLKILSRITEPTEGRVGVAGRVASLLEVGTGFHPELTGRENIFLNGAILGMTQAHIRRRFDEIVAFAEIDQFLDTPVKRYSSGMYVRLAFAVAAHLEPDVLIIDEVLAVGDAQFQRKCVGKMGGVAREGRTVLVVSHNLGLMQSLCDRALLLERGTVAFDGATGETIARYIGSTTELAGARSWPAHDASAASEAMRLLRAAIVSGGEPSGHVPIDRDVAIEYDFAVHGSTRHASSSVHLIDKLGVTVFCSAPVSAELVPGTYRHRMTIPAHFLNDGMYSITIFLLTDVTRIQVRVPEALAFFVHETPGAVGREEYRGVIGGCVRPRLAWELEVLGEKRA